MNAPMEQRIATDLEERALNGAYVYLAAWLIIGGGAGYHLQQPTIFWSLSFALLLLGILRLLAYYSSDTLRRRSKTMWRGLLYFNALIPTLILSSMFAVSMVLPAHQSIYLFLMMANFAFVSGGTVSFSPNRTLSLAYLFCTVAPPFIASVFFATENRVLGMLMALYAIFMSIQVTRLNREYAQLIEQQQKLKALSNKDALTGIGNRRFFDNALSLGWNTHIRTQANLSLLIIDIDHFKRVNDTFGHATGDKVIVKVAETIQRVCQRKSDTVARIGGEEFAVLIAVAHVEDVSRLAERIRDKVSKTFIRHDGEPLSVTVSVGGCVCEPDAAKDQNRMFERADQALYQAKNEGRNRVVILRY
ncbi:GGDEF domain-containing protein [Aestuariibacter sp. AA17]|uniref:diguanylate cyclase n=1 Tax=Fluctibacter corallii TaxID=2984329 RepID=A0ABT3A4D8_9ALTE|nr:GGDEF domain-containing protein [Aestuariibacter sp. AA17]MCV2883544.1 GGDEF domain-containing protein [Aestuariibacter sp. AA17]